MTNIHPGRTLLRVLVPITHKRMALVQVLVGIAHDDGGTISKHDVSTEMVCSGNGRVTLAEAQQIADFINSI